MVAASEYLVDTNILLRLSQRGDPRHQVIDTALHELEKQRANLYFSMQNMAELWNVCTRPVARNGYGLSTAETSRHAAAIEHSMRFLPDDDRVYSIWRQLVVAHNVRGVQVHDARLVAIMLAHGVTHLLTMNQSDFARYANIQAIHPSQLQIFSP